MIQKIILNNLSDVRGLSEKEAAEKLCCFVIIGITLYQERKTECALAGLRDPLTRRSINV
jgi:hypothetical protein